MIISTRAGDESEEGTRSRLLVNELQAANQCLRDIVALSTLPAIWSGADPLRIAESLAAALFTTLYPEFVFVSFSGGSGQPPFAVAQTDRYETDPALAEKIGSALWDWARARDPDDILLLHDPRGSAVLQVVTRALGPEAALGVIGVAFADAASPRPLDHLILNVAASQAVAAFQNAQLLRSLRESEERVRQTNEDLTRHVAELERTTVDLRDARRAALNVMEDAVQSRERAESLNRQLRQEIADRKRAEENAQRLARIVESSDDAIVSIDLDGIIGSWNGGAERLYGYTAAEAIGEPVYLMIPADRREEERAILERIRRGEHINHFETVRQHKDGRLVDISLTISPVTNARGTIIGASKVARDITERKRAQEQQRLLLREMSHRVKNLFSITSGIVTLSARTAHTPSELASAVRDRLAALSRAHELTRPGLTGSGDETSRDTSLHVLLRTIFAPYVRDRSKGLDGIIVSGSDLAIGGDAITNMALVLHELATNAAKYGALSVPDGVVHIDCSTDDGTLALTWKELGGPALDREPGADGFGGLLMRRIVNDQFGGQLTRTWEREGLIVRMTAPLDRLTS